MMAVRGAETPTGLTKCPGAAGHGGFAFSLWTELGLGFKSRLPLLTIWVVPGN